MTLQQLEYVMAVYRFRHFARAAEHCEVTQPSLSAMIQKLEDELGLKIFDRRRQPVEPTKAGLEIIAQARELLVGARRLKETAGEYKSSLGGTFSVGVLPTVAPYLVPRFFPKLMNDHPETDIRITEMRTEEMLSAMARGELDAGILARVDGLEGMDCHTLYYERFFAYVAEGEALSAHASIKTSDLAGEYLWLLDEGHCFRDQLLKYCRLKSAIRSQRSYHLGSIETFMRIVESGKGVTFIPELAMLQLSEAQRRLVRPFALPVPTREVVMMTVPGFVRLTLLGLIIEAIRSSVPGDMLRLRHTQQRV